MARPWYFISKQTTQCEYLLVENLVNRESILGSDVEIMAASALLDADIYVAKNDYKKPGSMTREVRWSLLRVLPTLLPLFTSQITAITMNLSYQC